MANISLQDMILENRDLELNAVNTYILNSDIIVGENSVLSFKSISNISFALPSYKIKLKTTSSRIMFDSLLDKVDVETFITNNIVDGIEGSDKTTQIASDQFPCILSTTKVKTTKGFIAANELKNDTILVTHDNRQVPIVNIYASSVTTNDKNSPYIIPAHYFTRNYPKKQFMISPLHAVATNKKATEWFIPREHGSKLKRMKEGNKIEYYHIEMPNWLTDHLVLEGETLVESYGVNFHKGLESVFYIRSRETGYYKRDLGKYKAFLSLKSNKERLIKK